LATDEKSADMAPPRLPNNVLQLNGAWDKNPDRARPPTVEDEEEASPTAPAMELITFDQAWAAIIEMAPPGVLRRRDEGAIFECARHYMLIRNQTTEALRRGRMPEIEPSLSTSFRNWLAKLGCTPVDSNHVAAPRSSRPKGDFE